MSGIAPSPNLAASPSTVGKIAAAAAVVVAGAALAVALLYTRTVTQPVTVTNIEYTVVEPATIARHQPEPRTLASYHGLGAWADGFDYSPPYAASGVPPLVPAAINQMAEFGVQTLYLQSGRLDDRSPDLVEDRWLLTEFLMRAAARDIDVIAWYLPKWTEPGPTGDSIDLDHLLAAATFDVLGYRFDGVAVDIEWNADNLEVPERNRRFITLSQQLRTRLPGEPIGAIVLPPVQTEVINPTFWPEFPWAEIAGLYDVWLPMSYWSFRTAPYSDPYAYNLESTQRLRANLDDPEAPVHAIGGIGGQVDAPPPGTEPYIARVDQLDRFVQSLVDGQAIGGSIYDWLTLDDAGRASMRNLFSTGPAAELGAESE